MSPRRAQASVGHRPAGGWAVACLLLLAPFVYPAPLRADVVEDLKRLNPHLQNDERIPRRDLKWMTLAESPYMFFRGTCDLYAEWFQANCGEYYAVGQPRVQLHGDVHPGNSGTYEPVGKFGSGELTFGLVDMDEAFVGPVEYDLLRALTALRFIAAEQKLDIQAEKEWDALWLTMAQACRAGIDDPQSIPLAIQQSQIVKKRLKKARKAKPHPYLASYVDFSTEEPVFRRLRFDDGELEDITIAITDHAQRQQLIESFLTCIRRRDTDFGDVFDTGKSAADQIIDVVEWVRLGSSGSQGLRKFLLLTKPARARGDSYQIIQLKQKPIPAAERARLIRRGKGKQRAEQVAAAYRILQAPRKALIGWTTFDESTYLVKAKIHNGKEPKPKHHKNTYLLKDMGAVLGGLLGAAYHRSVEQDKADTKRAEKLLIETLALRSDIAERSAAYFENAMIDYEGFRIHPEVIAAKKRARDWIAAQKEQHRISRVDN